MAHPKNPIVMPEAYTFPFRSAVAGVEFQVFISLPTGYEKTGKAYPVLYVVDANLAFYTVTETVRYGSQMELELPEMIVVGIGYPPEVLDQLGETRFRDFTPTEASPEVFEESVRHGMVLSLGCGGAGRLVDFIRQELIPLIDAEYRTRPDKRALWGDSLGGLFALYVLFEHPEIFHYYVIGSPYVHWDNSVILKCEEAYAKTHRDLPAVVFLAVGDKEEEGSLYPLAMIRHFYQIDGALRSRKYPGLDLTTKIFPGETHSEVFTTGMVRGLRAVFRRDVRGIEAFYDDLKK
jgi:uncharacterized protein